MCTPAAILISFLSGEQGDTLMPLLISFGQHSALGAAWAWLINGERMFAFLDDVYVTTTPNQVGTVQSCNITESTYIGKTHVSNAAGIRSPVCDHLERGRKRKRIRDDENCSLLLTLQDRILHPSTSIRDDKFKVFHRLDGSIPPIQPCPNPVINAPQGHVFHNKAMVTQSA